MIAPALRLHPSALTTLVAPTFPEESAKLPRATEQPVLRIPVCSPFNYKFLGACHGPIGTSSG